LTEQQGQGLDYWGTKQMCYLLISTKYARKDMALNEAEWRRDEWIKMIHVVIPKAWDKSFVVVGG